ncbi:hypothetical protein BHAOGJBA_6173 [Methylobacterium hispanicum]|uniref:Glycosyl transferase family 1 domain-containing protein n=1 Tax=Methylobacterium hispanicum TaxID=270350 RepID=A0AAV4ZVM4_9HYPH|nr:MULTISPECIES: glycosyltransferase [Methylobacterium]GJD92617.1 hypothetical protein BHAOGJBA_6173 [Methylobacterium hispanicum]
MISRIIIVDAAVRDAYGHFAIYTEGLYLAALERGFAVRCAVSRACDNVADRFGGEKILNFPAWGNASLARFTYAGNWVNCGVVASEGYARLQDFDLTPNDLLLVHSIQPHELFGLGVWYKSVPQNLRPRMSIGLHTDAEMYAGDEDRDLVNILYAKSLSIFKEFVESGSVELNSTNDRLSEYMTGLAGCRVRTAPLIVPTDDFPHRTIKTSCTTKRFLYSGSSSEKGINTIYELCLLLRSNPLHNTQLIVHISQKNVAQQFEQAIGKVSGVEIISGSLSRKDYANLFVSADAILLPYALAAYARRASGMLSEALSLGIPAIVTPDTPMSDELINNGLPGRILTSVTPHAVRVAMNELSLDFDIRSRIANNNKYYFAEKLTANRYLSEVISSFKSK